MCPDHVVRNVQVLSSWRGFSVAPRPPWRLWRHRRTFEPSNPRTLEPSPVTLECMQLRNARLCLDCEEVHDSQQCPLCASETFVFITRWVPAPERRQKPRTGEPPPSPELDTYREMLT